MCLGVNFKLINKKQLLFSLCLIGFSLGLPAWLRVEQFRVHPLLWQGLAEDNQALVLGSALSLVMLNSIRCCPHYLGVFILTDAFEMTSHNKKLPLAQFSTAFALIYLVYHCIFVLHHVQYDFGMPAFLLIIFQTLLWYLNFSHVTMLKRLSILLFVLIGLQFLDLLPSLNGLPFGQGETSQDIKLVSQLMDMEMLLNTTMVVGCFLFMLIATILFLLIRDENRLREISTLQAEQQMIYPIMMLQELKNRSAQELQHLVHDLKTPLTSIQTFAYVTKQKANDPDIVKYMSYVEDSVDNMSTMISEILYESHVSLISGERLLNSVTAQISPSPYASCVHVVNHARDAYIKVNRVRLVRAIINLTDNANKASSPHHPLEILLTLDRAAPLPNTAKQVVLTIEDNGVGISPDDLSVIWQRGTSFAQSSGLGLSFVQEVIEQSGGTIAITSELGSGTCITITLPEGENEHDETH